MDSISHDNPSLPTDSTHANNDDLRVNLDPISDNNDDLRMNLDPISANNDDLRANLDQNSASNDDPGLNIGSILLHCVNCGMDVSSRRRHAVQLQDVLTILQRWTAPQLIEHGSIVCQSCWIVALNESSLLTLPSTSTGQQRQLCVNCHCSLYRTRSHTLIMDTEMSQNIGRVIADWIQPRQLSRTNQVCHTCWIRASRAVQQQPPDNESEEELSTIEIHVESSTIELPNLLRAAESQSQCFVHGCDQAERLIVHMWLKVKLFKEFSFYIPPTSRICRWHLSNYDWEFIRINENYYHLFSATHIEDFASFIKEKTVDWNNLNSIDDSMFFHYVGLNKTQFAQLMSGLTINNRCYGKIAVIAFLCKLRTGESNERLATIFDKPEATIRRYMNKARQVLAADFLPQNLGLSHITRDEISSRNLLIPRELFTTMNNNEPILIIDGTYIYVQKSSNYLYQKNTYSLHKYRNLIKPLLIVCSDGYIVDVLGPYPAITSDAEIMLEAFGNNDQPLRQYFQAGDIFILDRGFRDCISLMEQCNYSPHMPASLQPGETQLSTLAANNSRKITMCRWVVEAVNGIMKKCFKLFRHEYFNAATTHAIIDFKIAAALVNKFHQRFVDREDAGMILQRINEVELRPNQLADYVIQNNLNRRRTIFNSLTDIHVPFPTLTFSELIIIACGTYQLKQAKSYYQESLRRNGTYIIEICNGSNLLDRYPSAENCTLIRGKIQSRHVSRKTYFVYILFENHINGINAIKEYYCNCIVGRRTIGCCAHVCTIIWYLSWARHQDHINLPAQYLDNMLIVYEEQ